MSHGQKRGNKKAAHHGLYASTEQSRQVLKMFWPEAVNWAFYVLNRCTRNDSGRSMVWVEALGRAFQGIWLYCSCSYSGRSAHKLDSKSTKCVLFGVSTESKGYRLYDPIGKRIVVSKDVIFEEEKSWDLSKSHSDIFSNGA